MSGRVSTMEKSNSECNRYIALPMYFGFIAFMLCLAGLKVLLMPFAR